MKRWQFVLAVTFLLVTAYFLALALTWLVMQLLAWGWAASV